MVVSAAANDGAKKMIPSPVGGLPVDTRIQDYRIKGVIGEGGFAIVYLAEDVMLHREIAVKEYMPSSLAIRKDGLGVAPRSKAHSDTFEKGLHSFINEARLLARFKHPALVDVLRFWEENGTAYMAMPYYSGKTLREVLRQADFRCDELWLRKLLMPLLGGLQSMHQEKCFHRDISTDNVMLLRDGSPVLLDFGAARRIVAEPDQLATVILKPGFAPIEQYSDDASAAPQGPWTDIYALCAVCYLAITGRMPITSVARIMRDPVVPLVSMNLQGYSHDFLSAIDKGLAVRPEDRPQTLSQFLGLLGKTQAARPDTEKNTEKASPLAEKVVSVAEAKELMIPSGGKQEPEAMLRRDTRSDNQKEKKRKAVSTQMDVLGDETIIVTDNKKRSPHHSNPTGPIDHSGDNALRFKVWLDGLARWRRTGLAIGALILLGMVALIVVWPIPKHEIPPVPEDAPANSPQGTSQSSPSPAVSSIPVIPPSPVLQEPGNVDAGNGSDPDKPTVVNVDDVPVEEIAPTIPIKASNTASVPSTDANVTTHTDADRTQPATGVPSVAPREDPNPAGSVIAVPDRTYGSTTLTPPSSVYRDGSSDAHQDTNVQTDPAPASHVDAHVVVANRKGSVDLIIRPWGRVSVDGQYQGVTPPLRRIQLPVGQHRLVVSHPLGADYVKDITVSEGRSVEVTYDFASRSTSQKRTK